MGIYSAEKATRVPLGEANSPKTAKSTTSQKIQIYQELFRHSGIFPLGGQEQVDSGKISIDLQGF